MVFFSVLTLLIVASTVQSIIKPTEATKEYFCTDCNIGVELKTKHCNRCQVCIEGFDHHCTWLNICIGKQNYKLFAFTMTYSAIVLSLEVAYQLAVSLVAIQNHVSLDHSIEILSDSAKKIILGIDVGLNLIVVIMLVQLMLFHLYLYFKGISTYEFIMRNRVKPQVHSELTEEHNMPHQNLAQIASTAGSPNHNLTPAIEAPREPNNPLSQTGPQGQVLENDVEKALPPSKKRTSELQKSGNNVGIMYSNPKGVGGGRLSINDGQRTGGAHQRKASEECLRTAELPDKQSGKENMENTVVQGQDE